jgi:hypothetical protein
VRWFVTLELAYTHIALSNNVAQRAEENRRLYDDLRAIYRDTVRAFAAAIDINRQVQRRGIQSELEL